MGESNKVKRFSFTVDDAGQTYMQQCAHGEYVRFNDFDSREGGLLSAMESLQSQLSHLTQQRDGLLLAMRAMHIEYMDYLSMLIDEYPAAQSRGGTFLTVLLREKQNLLLDSTRRAALTPAQEAQT